MTTTDEIAELVNSRDFTELFISKLGWDSPKTKSSVTYKNEESGIEIQATPVATKRGVVVYSCPSIVDRETLEALDRMVAKRSKEHLFVMTEDGKQRWSLPVPRKSAGTRYANHDHSEGEDNDALFQRLRGIKFEIGEEKDITLLDVLERVRTEFDVEKVTKAFYDDFKSIQQKLLKQIEGFSTEENRSWYSSLLLNRLMFIYFLQDKKFMNKDRYYLRTSLERVKELKGDNQFYNYYKDFLLPLFHEGLGSDNPRHYEDKQIKEIIGKVPYVNGGIFSVHQLESDHPEIHIPDESFEKIFDLFDGYRWRLDERQTGNPKEINPEILGYIFEKFVNQKDMGAYYTKEDVTSYMSAMTILPVFLDKLSASLKLKPWHLLKSEPSLYMPEGLRYGCDEELPDDVKSTDPFEVGILDDYAHPGIGLPGERWRETLDRRKRVEKLHNRLADGSINSSTKAVTENLNLQAIALDWITELSDEHAVEIWDVLSNLKIVDPTCGSGAFLFAALGTLEELYDCTLSAIEKAVANETADERARRIGTEASRFESREYFLRKTIVLDNLYGLDIMPEATEIARLRLFLALASRLHENDEVDPLPDLDMNIREGNLLVGCSTSKDAEERFAGTLFDKEQLNKIGEKAEETASLYSEFVDAQMNKRPPMEISELKKNFQDKTALLRDELDLLYSPQEKPGPQHDDWRKSHRPFHWFVEFPEVMIAREGGGGGEGFDAVIGNPPYINKKKITSYTYSGFKTDNAPDIYAPCMERAATLVNSGGGYAMIVPISFQFSERFSNAREVITQLLPTRLVSTYSRRPTSLFDAGIGVRSTIVIGRANTERYLATTEMHRWPKEGRMYLFDTNQYVPVELEASKVPWPRIGHPEVKALYEALVGSKERIANAVRKTGPAVGFKMIAMYYLSAYIDSPPAWMDGKRIEQPSESTLNFESEEVRDIAFMLLSGRLAYWWWMTNGDDFHLTSGNLKSFPIAPKQVEAIWTPLLALAKRLREEQPLHPSVTLNAGKVIGNYDMKRCRHITDEAEKLILETLGLSHLWPAVLFADARAQKATGEGYGTKHEWPHPW